MSVCLESGRITGGQSVKALAAVVAAVFLTAVISLPLRAGSPISKERLRKDWCVATGPVLAVTISKATTRIDGPLTDEGYVDYLAALNDVASQGVAPHANAAVLFWQAIGPGVVDAEDRAAFFESDEFKSLRVRSLPDEQECFIAREDFIENTSGIPQRMWFDGEQMSAVEATDRQLQRAMREPWSRKEYPALAAWLQRNEKPLGILARAALQQQYYSPIKYSGSFPDYRTARAINDDEYFFDPLLKGLWEGKDALLARSMLHLEEGRLDDSWKDLLTCMRLARVVSRGPLLAHFSYATLAEARALEAAVALVRRGEPSPDRLRRYLADVRNLPERSGVAEKLDVAGRFAFLDFVSSIPRKRRHFFSAMFGRYNCPLPFLIVGSPTLWVVNWDEILRVGNAWYDKGVVVARQPTRKLRDDACRKLRDEFYAVWRTIIDGRELRVERVSFYVKRPWFVQLVTLGLACRVLYTDVTERTLIVYMEPSIALYSEAMDEKECTARSHLLDTALALARYRRDHGTYPPTLAKLLPNYLPNPPEDPFSTGILQYRQDGEGYLLYSIGRDEKDDGGTCDPEDEWEGDIVVRTSDGRESDR